MKVRRIASWGLAVALAAAAVVAPTIVGGGAGLTPVAHADVTGTGGDFVQVPSAVLADSRSGYGVAKAALGTSASTTIAVLGHGGVPSTGVRAVLLNLSVFAPTASTYLTVYRSGTTFANDTSSITVAAKANLSNTVAAEVGADGRVALFNRSGSTNFAVAVLGYYTSATAASGPGGYHPSPYTRVLDTRSGVGAAKAKIAAGKYVSFTVTGGQVPADADSVYLDVIVPATTAGGYLTVNAYGASSATAGVLDWSANSVTSHVVAVRPAGGRISIVNHSSVAIDLVATQEGYTSSSTSTGDGFHPTRQRLINGTAVAANSTVTVPIVGRAGLPTQNISGVMANLYANSSAAGYLRAWATGTTEPSVSALDFPAGVTRGGLASVAVASAGSITIRNMSTVSASVTIDLEGWFSPEHRTAGLQRYTPTVGVQLPANGTAPGAIEYSYTDNVGRLLVGYQPDPDVFYNGVTWRTVSSIGDIYTGMPAVSVQSDGSLSVNARYGDTGVRTSVLPAAAIGQQKFGAAFDTGGSFATAPSVAKMPSNSVLYSFAVDDGGALWIRAAGSGSVWLPHRTVSLRGAPTAVSVGNGIQLFGTTTGGTVVTALYQGGTADPVWTDLGGNGVADVPAVAVRPGYLFQVVVRDGTGQIVTKAQDSNGSFPAAWSPVGTFTAAGAPATVFDPVSGRIEILARSSDDNQIYSSGETVQGSQTWRSWASASNGVASATDPTIFTYSGASNGDGWAAPFRTADNGTQVITSNYPNGTAAGTRPAFNTSQVPSTEER